MKNISRISLIMIATLLLNHVGIAQIQEPIKNSKESEIDIKTYTGVISEQYANGSPSRWKTLVNGKTEGLWLEWYPNGTLRYRAYWKNSEGNGKWEYFYPNGQLRSESFYINDITQGMYKSYHENGQLKYDATFINGKKDGLEFTYDANGLLLSRKRFENGIQCIDEPLIFQEGRISVSTSNEWSINFMPDGKTMYFTRKDNNTGEKRIYTSTKTKDEWSIPIVATFSTDEDEAPFITANGNTLYFASYRPLPNGKTTEKMDMNIWYMDRIDEKWSAPKPVSDMINKSMEKGTIWPANYEAGPCTDKNGNLYYWTKGSKNEGTNLYYAALKSNGTYSKPVELIPPSSDTHYDTAPQLSPDGNILFFSSDDRYDGYGGSDIYYSVKKDGNWSTPKNLGPIVNSSQSEGFPSFSPDGKYFYFSSNRGDLKDANGDSISNLYYMETRFLMIEK